MFGNYLWSLLSKEFVWLVGLSLLIGGPLRPALPGLPPLRPRRSAILSF